MRKLQGVFVLETIAIVNSKQQRGKLKYPYIAAGYSPYNRNFFTFFASEKHKINY